MLKSKCEFVFIDLHFYMEFGIIYKLP